MPKLIACSRTDCLPSISVNQKGATLIEAMIAMFVLAFGVLVLMIAQLRSVSNVQEAENQTLVAQAAQTLMEGMLVNPDLSKNAANVVERNYDAYVNANIMSLTCAAADVDYNNGTSITKADLARSQLCRFRHELNTKLPNATDITAHVCRGNPTSGNCNTGSSNYIIVASWKMQAKDTSSGGTTDAVGVGDDGLFTYRYVLAVQE